MTPKNRAGQVTWPYEISEFRKIKKEEATITVWNLDDNKGESQMTELKPFYKSRSVIGNIISIAGPVFYGIFSTTNQAGTHIIISKTNFVIMCCIIVAGGLIGLYGTLKRKTEIKF